MVCVKYGEASGQGTVNLTPRITEVIDLAPPNI